MSLYSRHLIPRTFKPHCGKDRLWRFSQSAFSGENQGFWYKGVRKVLGPAHTKHVRQMVLNEAVKQIYNSSPLLTALLSNAQGEEFP